MKTRHWLAVCGAVAAGAFLYRRRRAVVGQFLGLPPPRYDVRVRRNLRVPVAEGITLATDHYAPLAPGTFPTILIRTPYGRQISPAFSAQRFAERGYHVVVQDVRGRFGSEGTFQPFLHETADGQATLAWLARQPWHSGPLGTWGASYLGYVQWAVATAQPGAVDALCPIVASSRGAFTGEGQGGFQFELALRWMVLLDALNSLGGKERGWAPWRALWRLFPAGQNRVVQPLFEHRPVAELDRLVTGKEIAYYRQSLQSSRPAAWTVTDRRPLLAQGEAPVHLVGGWYDFMLADLLEDYAALRAGGRSPYLTIGPWHHLDWRLRGAGLRIGLAWFDAQLKGKSARLPAKPVRVFVSGKDEWQEWPAWPPPSTITPYYLQGNAGLARHRPPATVPPDSYTYDPADPTPALGGARFGGKAGPVDNRSLEARPDVLTYTTPPLADALAVVGPVRAILYVTSTLPHADFFCRLCDVDESGRSLNLCDGLYRLGPERGEAQADGTVRVEVDMVATAHWFQPGHRLRLQLSSGAHPRYLSNPGTGAPLATAVEMQAATQTIYHDAAHPSVLLLPVTGG